MFGVQYFYICCYNFHQRLDNFHSLNSVTRLYFMPCYKDNSKNDTHIAFTVQSRTGKVIVAKSIK